MRFLGVPRLILGRRAASCWLWDASSACSSSLNCFSSGDGGVAMPGGSSPVARHAQSSSDSTVLDSRERCFSVCCSRIIHVRPYPPSQLPSCHRASRLILLRQTTLHFPSCHKLANELLRQTQGQMLHLREGSDVIPGGRPMPRGD